MLHRLLGVAALACVCASHAFAVPMLGLEGFARTGAWVDDQQAMTIGRRVWENESGGTLLGLTHWGYGEEFASLGIGHFIWYPETKNKPFQESFPGLLSYMEARGTVLPEWLKGSPACPWPDRETFLREKNSPRMKELREFLGATIHLQARFMADRLEAALPRVLNASPERWRDLVKGRFEALAAQPHGLYALMDYVNFKGEGIGRHERYGGKGWGLLQALLFMRGRPEGTQALQEFSRATRRVLTRRIKHAPPERGESRWLPGWTKRIRTYADA